MQRRSWMLIVAVAVSLPALAQTQPAPRTEEEGFFRPLPPAAKETPPPPQPDPATEAAILEAAVLKAQVRESVERDLARAEREAAGAREEAAKRPPPIVASPLDGTAPITSPLDGTAPIVSPLGR